MARHPFVLYATAGCATCEIARAYFRSRGVEFVEIDVAADPAALRYLAAVTGHAFVPTIMSGDDVQVGWDEARVAEMIDDPLPDEVDQLEVIFAEIEERVRQRE